MVALVKDSFVLIQNISDKDTGIQYLWYQFKVDERLIKNLVSLGFEALENYNKS